MKLAIWTTKFPDLTETFIQAEAEYLAGQYEGLVVCTLKSSDKIKLPVHHFAWADPRNLLAFASCWLSDFSKMSQIGFDLWQGFENCPRPWERLKSFMLWPAACRARAQLKKQGVSHLMSHWANVPSTVAWVCSRLEAWPLVMVLHGENLSSIWPLLETKCREASRVITCTQFNKQRLEDEIEGLEVVFNSHGVSLPAVEEKDMSSQKFSGLSVARLVKTKGLNVLLQAIKQMKEEGEEIYWTIIGEGPEEESLKSYCEAEGIEENVSFKGALSHEAVQSHYKNHHVFALPVEVARDGDSDGLPNVILEAMAHGCPVISSRCAGVEEAIDAGETGLLIESGDLQALVRALKEIKNNPEKSQGIVVQARRLLEDRFDRHNCHQALNQTLQPFLAQET